MDQNPYEPPRFTDKPTFSDTAPDLAALERRVAELESRVNKSWFVGRHFLYRMFAVWGYFLLGYALFAAIAFPIFWLLDAIFRL